MAEPVSTIDQLITSANSASDHARALVAGMLFTALVMAAMVVGTSDQAILLDSIELAPTLGVRVSVSIAHLFAPIILLFFHVGALIQLDLTDARWHLLSTALQNSGLDPAAQAHQRARIHGAIEAHALGRDAWSEQGSGMRRAIAWISIVWIPLLVLLALQISFVRYQSWPITIVQKIALAIDAAFLVWFFWQMRRRRLEVLRCHWGIAFMAAVLGLGTLNANPPDVDAMARDVRWVESNAYARYTKEDATPQQWDNSFDDGRCSIGDRDAEGHMIVPNWRDVYLWPVFKGCNLLDIYLCPYAKWGCRYLRLSNSVQIAGPPTLDLLKASVVLSKSLKEVENPKHQLGCKPLYQSDPAPPEDAGPAAAPAAEPDEAQKAAAKEKAEAEELAFHVRQAQLRAVGLRLRDRSFRFADFKDAVFYGVDLVNAQLQGANLEEAKLQWAWLDGAKLNGAMLDDAYLQDASLQRADLGEASMRNTHLQGADMVDAQLVAAFLNRSDLSWADLSGADLTDAKLRQASLVDVKLQGATLVDADLDCAQLTRVDLRGASLQGADLSRTTGEALNLDGVWFAKAMADDATAAGSSMNAATYGYLVLTEDKVPDIINTVVDDKTRAAPPGIDEIAEGLKALACDDSRIGGGMVRWLTAAQSAFAANGEQAKVDATRKVMAVFAAAIKEHEQAVKDDKPFHCPGLADLYLTEEVRAAFGLD